MIDPRKKPFLLNADQFRDYVVGLGACIASDMITCEGRKVGFMYREKPDNEVDSGWRFMSGWESEEYNDDPDNATAFDVNTIANYDPEIVPFLLAPVGSAFERKDGVGAFAQVFDFEPPGD